MKGNLSKRRNSIGNVYKKTEVDRLFFNSKSELKKYVDSAAGGKVDKVDGKGLSANDYTDSDKAEVAKVKDKVDKVKGKGLIDDEVSERICYLQPYSGGPTLLGGADMYDKIYIKDFAAGSISMNGNINCGEIQARNGVEACCVSLTDDVIVYTVSTPRKAVHKLSEKANTSDVLTKDNTTEFTPASDYHPATKKYVDDNKTSVVDNLESTSATSALSANQGKVINDKITALPIKSLAGQMVKPTYNGDAVTAGEGATIIGDLRDRAYDPDYGYSPTGNVASGEYSTAIGKGSTASGYCSTAIGIEAMASGDGAIAMGTAATASGMNSFAFGQNTASGIGAIAMGISSKSSGDTSIALGENLISSGFCSIAAGSHNQATGDYSTAMGCANTALSYQFKIGHYAKDGTAGASSGTTGDAFIIGNGTNSTTSNAFRVTYAGKAYGLSAFAASGADYAEYFEWEDGNPNNEDRRGKLVTLVGEKIRFATADDDYILGVVSAAPCVVGDVQSEDWQGKWLTDAFGEKLTQTVHIPARYEERETTDPETGETTTESVLIEEEHDAVQWVLNPEFDASKNEEYISREDRKEWSPVGMIGKLVVVDDGTCEVNGYCKAGINGIATKADNGYRVMKRIDETHILVLVR